MDIYLDYGITVSPDIGNNSARVNTAMPLAIHAISRPLFQKEPVPRGETIVPSKAKSEGALEEIRVVLGWVYNTCTFYVILPIPIS